MKIINEKGRLFGFVNIIDLGALLLAVAVAALFLYIKSGSGAALVSTEKYETKEITVMYLVQGVRDATVNAFSVGDSLSVIDEDSDLKAAGVISDMEVSPHQVSSVVDGRVVYAEVPDKYDIRIYTTVEANIYDDEIKIGTYVPRVGLSLFLQTLRLKTSGVVYYISE